MKTACFTALIFFSTQQVWATGLVGSGVHHHSGLFHGNVPSSPAPFGHFPAPPIPMTGPTPPMTTGAIPPMTTGRVDGQGYRSGMGVPGVIVGPPIFPYIPPSIGSGQIIQTPQGNGFGR